MASKEPPIIRSSKAFSVEIPEGSSSAKSRKSDVVPGSLDIPVSSDPQFESLALGDKFLKPEAESNFDAAIRPGQDQESSRPDLSYTQNVNDRQLAAIAKDGMHDHLVGVANDSLQDHVVGVANDNLQDHLVGVANDGLKDRLVGIANDAIEDRFTAVPEPAAPIPLFVSADDDFPDDHMEIEYAPEVDPNVQALSDEAIADHVIQVKVEKAALADVHIPSANAGGSESATPQPASARIPIVKKPPAVLTLEMIKQQEAEVLAKKQKMEEFRGRVEAIRNTVTNINAKLDHMLPTESKPSSH